MKILFTGGGTGGHFYPIIAVAEEVNRIAQEKKLLKPELYFMAPKPYDENVLFENNINFIPVTSGKVRRYFSLLNIIDAIKMPFGVIGAFWKLLLLYPDVIFSKGGYGSFPTLFAARFLRIPIIIHESDTVPGKVNAWSGRFAYRVALSYPETAEYFKKRPIAVVGNPIRREVLIAPRETSREYFGFDGSTPVVLILGGSQGSKIINESVLDILPELVKKYYVIHQTGSQNIEEIKRTAGVVLSESENSDRYRPYDTLKPLDLKMAAGAAHIVVSRAGSTIFEIALWSLPSILIPITESNGNHQRTNAYTYAHTGACKVIEENNLKPHVLLAEIDHILGDNTLKEKMIAGAKTFAKPDAAKQIAEQLVAVGLSHE